MNEKGRENKVKLYMKFVIPSLIGVFLFMCPIKFEGNITIPIAVMANWLQGFFAD